MWRWHELLVAFIAFVGFGIAFAAALVTSPSSQIAVASVNDNVMGWAWADPVGWISLNDKNPDSGGGAYGVNVDLNTGNVNGFAWSQNAGWICFGDSCSHPDCTGTPPPSNPPYNALIARLLPAPYQPGGTIRNFHGWAKVCNAGDKGWISLNCADTNPGACGAYAYRVPFDMTTHYFEDSTGGGSPVNGTSFGWSGNNDNSGFGYIDFRKGNIKLTPENNGPVCQDGLDNDLDGPLDCADNECAGTPPCPLPPPPLDETQCADGSIDLCCSNGIDDEFDGQNDCNDTDCQGKASMCTVAWLKTKFGNVYAQKGIESIAPPPNQKNATYCLSYSDGSIQGFASEANCVSQGGALSLPKSSTGYKGSLGAIDTVGIEKGRYGQVVPIADGNALPDLLDGKIYIYTGGGKLTLPAKTIQNGVGATGRGNGLLYVKGADLRIVSDITYASPNVQKYLKNLASFGVIVTRDPGTGLGGNILIDPGVTTMVGALFAESSLRTGVSNSLLTAYGLMASRQLIFERTGGTADTAAETVVFDGRAVANPPPGMQDIGKSLPTTKDAF